LRDTSIFEYFYGDASNFKSWGWVLLEGAATQTHVVRLKSGLDAEEFFIAEQLELPPLYAGLWALSNGPTSADHVWHTFHALRTLEINETNGPVFAKLESFVRRLETISQWNEKLSPHWCP
jgi:hypothetical protein